MPTVRRISTFPIKSLDPMEVDRTAIVGGALSDDREYAIVDADGDYVNGKRMATIHQIRASFGDGDVRLSHPGGDEETFALALDEGSRETDHESLSAWLSAYFDESVTLRRDRTGGFPDDTNATGPTVVSTATIREVASWFPDVDESNVRRRFRANVEIDDVPAFWEDRLFAGRDEHVAFEVDGTRFEGVNPCQRCVVPTRDPDTGTVTEGFRERFVRRREETLPSWSGGERFDHAYRLAINTFAPSKSWGDEIAVGDEVEIVGTVPIVDG